MLAKRIIPCLDVKEGQVVKGIQFRQHRVMGEILEFAESYSAAGADELVFYDITASSDQRTVQSEWIKLIAQKINIPFCVAGGIRSLKDAERVLNAGADKISINSPALENPDLIDSLVKEFGTQCIVVGIDSYQEQSTYRVYQYTGDLSKTRATNLTTATWLREVQARGAGEIVLNCMNQDGMRKGYDIQQLQELRPLCHIPLIASGGAGVMQDFAEVFHQAAVDGALAASVFHTQQIQITNLKHFLREQKIEVRIC